MLLTVSFGKSESPTASPLSPTEWGAFAGWLKETGSAPGDLLNGDVSALLQCWDHPKVTLERLQALLGRGAMLGFALEKWQRAGLWVLTRSDPEYPERLKRLLGRTAPAVLFGCGNESQLNKSGVAVVGSRRASNADIGFAEKIGRQAAECGRLVVSGGAAGVDQAAMLGALKAEGTAIGVLANNLLRAATSAKYRRPLMSGDLTLISPFNPEVRFFVGNAMARNKYIYCLAEESVVVSSVLDNGGTWTGAVENLKNGWVPLRVKQTETPGSGNPKLVKLGGQWLDNPDDLVCIASPEDGEQSEARDGDIQPLRQGGSPQPGSARGHPSRRESTDFADELYEKVRSLVIDLCTEPKLAKDIADALGVTKPTADVWIKRLLEERALERATRPVRYVVREKDLVD